ncbi:MAG: 50S ribosomal protein L29 [Ferruginibacter sp.]
MAKKVDFLASIKGLNEEDLKAKIREDELRLKKVSFAHSVSPLENPVSMRYLRRDIATFKNSIKKKRTRVLINHKFCNNE